MKKSIFFTLLLVCAMSLPALADTLSVGNQTIPGIGDSIGSAYDQLHFTGNNGTVDISGGFLVGDVTFTVGVNCYATPCPNSPATGFIFVPVLLNGQSGTLTIPWTVSISYADTFSFGAGTLIAGDYSFRTSAFGPVTVGNGDFVTSHVYANTPEPGSLALLGTGLFGAAAGFRRKFLVR